jgi:hypothetical protein
MPRVPRISKKLWSTILFGCSYVSCLLSPVVIGIEQKVILGSTLSIVLALCDIICLRELYNVVKKKYFMDKTCAALAASDHSQKPPPFYEVFIRFSSCSCLIILPLGNMLGMGGSGLAWFSVLRMVGVSSTTAAASTVGVARAYDTQPICVVLLP